MSLRIWCQKLYEGTIVIGQHALEYLCVSQCYTHHVLSVLHMTNDYAHNARNPHNQEDQVA